MTVYELIAKLTEKVAQTPALGECEANISVEPKSTSIEVNYNGPIPEIEGVR